MTASVAAQRILGALLIIGVALGAAGHAGAAGWGRVVPGDTTRRDVETIYGKPSREGSVVEDGRTGSEWTYLSDRCPQGVNRMVVAYGLIRNGQFVPDLVRALTLYPDAGVFTEAALSNGWGEPVQTGTDDSSGRALLRYAEGLWVALDRTGRYAEVMTFAPAPRR